MMFSVVIPTLQRVAATAALVDDLTRSPHVGEILVINNAGTPLPYDSPKMRELRQTDNIFVNPAWNLGAAEATYDNLCFANDDIRFDVSILADVHRLLCLPIGIIAPHEKSFFPEIAAGESPLAPGRVRVTPVYRRTDGFGTLMFMRRRSFVPIPDVIKVWFGDDYLFHHQVRRNLAFSGVPIHTAMGATSRSPEFTAIGLAETEAFREVELGDYDRRFRRDLRVMRPLVRSAKAAHRRFGRV